MYSYRVYEMVISFLNMYLPISYDRVDYVQLRHFNRLMENTTIDEKTLRKIFL